MCPCGCQDEMERFAAEHGIAALLDHLGLDGLANEVEQLRAKLAAERGLWREELAEAVRAGNDCAAERDALAGALRERDRQLRELRDAVEREWREHLDEADGCDDDGSHVGFATYHRNVAQGLSAALYLIRGALAASGPDGEGETA